MDTDPNKILQILLKKHFQTPSYAIYSQLSTIGRCWAKDLNLRNVKVAVLRNITVEPLLPVISGELVALGFAPEMYIADFNATTGEVFNPESELYKFNPEYFLIFEWLETVSPKLTERFVSLTIDEINLEIERVLTYFDQLFVSIRAKSANPILLNNFPLPDVTTLGILDVQLDNAQTYTLFKLNLELLRISRNYSGIYWIDTLKLFNRLGHQNSFDEKFWQIAKLPFSKNILIPLGKEYGKFFKVLNGKITKCLVLDCDNTLWAGVVGEDGAKGIKITSSFKAFQQEILNLYKRGLFLALCSKNNEEDVLEVFRENSEMILAIEQIATWQINWRDKATNIKQIANDLNIALSSLVFVDDSAFECNLLRENVPDVAVIELGKNPTHYKNQLLSAGVFESLHFTEEDKRRNEMHALEGRRQELQKTAHSVKNYLFSLKIQATFGLVTDFELPRVAQLIQKTNQFNLTTKRHSESQIKSFISDNNYDVYYIHISDCVSSLGIIGVGIVQYAGRRATIDSLLLSCRSLGRGAENTLLSLMINASKARGCIEIIGEYIPTKKNVQVAEFYENQNFILKEKTNELSAWTFAIDNSKSYKELYPKWIQLLPQTESLKAHI